jgi:DNA-binding NarL/FixJ family response regulator
MSTENLLTGKAILVVDDEPDVLDAVESVLDMCIVHKAKDYDTGLQYILSYTYDVVVLDIMGVNGFELLKAALRRGFPTVMLTAHAITPEALKKSMKLGAVCFLPKEKITELESYLSDAVLGGGKLSWARFFNTLSSYFSERFGPDWKEKDGFFKDFEDALRRSDRDSIS